MRGIAPSKLRLLLLIPATLALGAGPCPTFPRAKPVRVQLDPSFLHQRIDGLGGSAANESSLRRLPEPSRSEVMDLVFGDLEPSVIRLKVWPALEPANDDADPAHVNAAGFVRPDDSLWQLAEIFARGAPRLMSAMWTPPAWMKTTGQECCGGTLLPGMDAELAELFSVYLGYFDEAGHPIDWLSIQNEPEAASPWDANTYDPRRMGPVAEAVAQRIVADGHATRMVGPDNAVSSFVQFFLPFLLAQPGVAALLDGVAFHHYGPVHYWDSSTVPPAMEELAAVVPEGLPLWMTEFSNTTLTGYGSHDEGIKQAELIHETLVGGAGMYVIWNLYRPGGPGEALIVIPTSAAPGYTITPKYWTARQYLKYVRPGARRIEATSGDEDLLVSAYRDDAAGTLVAVAINRSEAARWAVFEGAGFTGTPEVVRTTPTESGARLPADSTERFGDGALHLPARSVSTAIWQLDAALPAP